jgi:hypothetical protein
MPARELWISTAPLDPVATPARALEDLVRRLGWSPSPVVGEGLRLLAACYGRPATMSRAATLSASGLDLRQPQKA